MLIQQMNCTIHGIYLTHVGVYFFPVKNNSQTWNNLSGKNITLSIIGLKWQQQVSTWIWTRQPGRKLSVWHFWEHSSPYTRINLCKTSIVMEALQRSFARYYQCKNHRAIKTVMIPHGHFDRQHVCTGKQSTTRKRLNYSDWI